MGEDIETIAARQHQVEEDQIDAGTYRLFQPADAVGRLGNLVAQGAQGVGDAAADGLFVLDYDQTCGGHGRRSQIPKTQIPDPNEIRHPRRTLPYLNVFAPGFRFLSDPGFWVWDLCSGYSGIVRPFRAACSRRVPRTASSNALSPFFAFFFDSFLMYSSRSLLSCMISFWMPRRFSSWSFTYLTRSSGLSLRNSSHSSFSGTLVMSNLGSSISRSTRSQSELR